MTAAEIAAKLGEATNAGRGWWHCLCPICGKPKLGLKDGKKRLQIKCLHGCANKAIRAELKSRKLLNGKDGNGALHEPETEEELRARAAAEAAQRQRQIDQARDIWQQTLPAADSMAATYLASRGLDYHAISPALRFSPAVYHPDEKRTYPALVGLVKYKTGEDVAVHCICLNPLDPTSKLAITNRKISYGPTKGGAVCLSPYGAELGLSEGIETALAFQQSTKIPAWALMGDGGFASFEPPQPVELAPTLILIEDQDDPGRSAVAAAAARWAKEGYKIRIARPVVGNDINDALMELGPAAGPGICTINEYITITVVPGERHLAADDGLAALVTAQVPFYQRNKKIVRVATVNAKNSAGDLILVPGIVEVDKPMMERKLAHSAVWTTFDGRKKAYAPIDPPGEVATQILSMVGEWPFGPLRGIVQCATVRRDGTLLDQEGYDNATGLVLTNTVAKMPTISPSPTKQDAEAALERLTHVLHEFPFVDNASRSVALSMLITPVVRGAMDVAPMHLITKPVPGTGSSYLVDCAAMIATGEVCAVESMAPKYEETEKRLVGAALSGFPIIGIDNVREIVAGDFFCQVVERPLMSLRALSSSEKHRIPNTFTVFANGVNATVAEDMVRRTLRAALDANLEHPETREFKYDPLAAIQHNRGDYIAACLTIVRAYIVAGRPNRMTPPASFGGWSRFVREPLIWLGQPDPVSTQEKLHSTDPRKVETAEVFEAWGKFGVGKNMAKFTKEIVDKALIDTASPLFDALWAVAPQRHSEPLRKIDPKALGKWLASHEGQIASNYKLMADRTDATRPRWYLDKHPADPKTSVG